MRDLCELLRLTADESPEGSLLLWLVCTSLPGRPRSSVRLLALISPARQEPFWRAALFSAIISPIMDQSVHLVSRSKINLKTQIKSDRCAVPVLARRGKIIRIWLSRQLIIVAARPMSSFKTRGIDARLTVNNINSSFLQPRQLVTEQHYEWWFLPAFHCIILQYPRGFRPLANTCDFNTFNADREGG